MKRYGLLWMVVFISSCGLWNRITARRGTIISAPDATPARLVGSVPFRQLTGGVIVVRGRVNNDREDTLNFILDTGSGGVSLDSATCEELGLLTKTSNRYLNSFRGKKRLFFAHGNTLHLSGVQVDSLDFYINDYSFLSRVYGVKIDGIIGYGFLRRYIVKIDYNKKHLSIYTPGRYEYRQKGFLLHPDLRQIPLITADVQNKKAPVNSRFYFDIGAGLCLMLSSQFVEDSCLYCFPSQKKHKFVVAAMQSALGPLTMRKTVLDNVKVGAVTFHKIPVYLFDDAQGLLSYPSSDGLIGNDLLKRFTTTLNYPQDEIYLHPNTRSREPFDYAYTGITLYWMKGKTVVGKVISDSPGAAAGLEEGDVIIAIDHHVKADLQTYIKALKQVGKTIPVIFQRNGIAKKTNLHIKSIL